MPVDPISLEVFKNLFASVAVAVGNTETGQRIVDAVLGALAQALPGKIPAASQGTMNNFTFGGSHRHPLTPSPLHGEGGQKAVGKAFVYYETIAGGQGAGPLGDGISGRHSHMTNTRNTPVEALESALPVRVIEYALRDGSGGAGKHRGGDGIRRVYEFLAPATATINSERRLYAPYGLEGGESGERGRNLFKSNNHPVPSSDVLSLDSIKSIDQLLGQYAKSEQVNEIIQLLEALVHIYPNDIRFHTRLEAIYRQLGRKKDVISQLDILENLQHGLTPLMNVGGKWTGRVEAGDRIVIETPGGGGWGENSTED